MPITGEQLALFYFTVLFSGILWMPAWIVLSILTPKKLLNHYFKESHFTPTETIMMAQFPGFLLRTAIFGWLLVFPKLGRRKRRISNVKDYMPRWYRLALNILTFHALLILVTTITLLPVLVLMAYMLEV